MNDMAAKAFQDASLSPHSLAVDAPSDAVLTALANPKTAADFAPKPHIEFAHHKIGRLLTEVLRLCRSISGDEMSLTHLMTVMENVTADAEDTPGTDLHAAMVAFEQWADKQRYECDSFKIKWGAS